MAKVSIIIPARNEQYLQATIDDLLRNMKEEIEVIVGLDEYWPDPPLRYDERVHVYHSGSRIGMRPMINLLAAMATGKYLMKTDAHCAFDEGYDRKLIEICRPGCTVLGVRYELDVETWARKERTNCDFRYLSNPDADPRGGLRGLAWHEYKKRTKGQEVAETMSISGSGWLMEREQFVKWGGLDENHGTFGQEGCEISCKTWLSGGRVLVNRRTWYAHWNRGKAPYALSTRERDKSVDYSCEYWLNDRWPLQKYSFNWLIERFAPVPGWPEPQESVAVIPAPRQGTLFKGLRAKYHEEKTDITVADLWERRLGSSEPLKRQRLKIFFDAFAEVVEKLKSGKVYTKKDMEQERYFEYLRSHLGAKDRDPLTEKGRKHITGKFSRGIRLFHDIREHGLKTPLQCYRKDGNLILWRGYRRLVILHALGRERVPVMIHQSEETAKALPAKFEAPAPGSITALGEKQFVEWGGKSTDKYWVHGYLELYDHLFAGLRGKRIKILELGVARGASLRLWREAFPKAQIYGVDKNEDIWKEMAGGLEGVEVLVGKQQDEAFLKSAVIPKGPFDIIIDDAGHNPNNQKTSFEALWPHVAPFGWYVIEDCYVSYKRENRGRPCIPKELAEWVDKIYTDYSVLSMHFIYNLCAVRKGI